MDLVTALLTADLVPVQLLITEFFMALLAVDLVRGESMARGPAPRNIVSKRRLTSRFCFLSTWSAVSIQVVPVWDAPQH